MKTTVATRKITLCARFAALTAVCSQIAIPLPLIPINLALFSVYLAGGLLGAGAGTVSQLVFALLGAVGVPVFQGFTGGPGVLFGPTGGYIIGYLAAAWLTGWLSAKWGYTFWKLAAAMAIGLAACYLFGTVWFMILMKNGLVAALGKCVLPFLPGDAVKIALAAVLVKRLHPLLAQWIR